MPAARSSDRCRIAPACRADTTALRSGGDLRREPFSPARCSDRVSNSNGKSTFYPRAVDSFEEAGLNPAIVESLVLKFLMNTGMAPGRRIAAELGLPFGPFPDFLRGLKNQQILAYANSASANDYVYSLTDTGRARAKMYLEECAYVGPAPVPFDDYLESVAAQTITTEHPKEADLRRAFSDLLIAEETFRLLGPAINSGRGLFLYGYPGNGKTSIAERITRCFGTTVWIPKVIQAEGQIIKLFDMANHEPVETQHVRRVARRVRPRPPLGPDQAPDDRRRGRAANGRPRDPLRSRDQDQRGPASAQEQPGDVPDRRLRPPAHAAGRALEPLDRPARKALRLPQPRQRQEDPGSV